LLSSPGQITLSGNPTFQTNDPDKAGRHLSPYLCQHTVSTRHDKNLSFKHCHSDVGGVGIHLLRYGVDLTISGSPGNDCYIMLLLLEGWGELKQNGAHSIVCPENVCVINPDKNISLYLTALRNRRLLLAREELLRADPYNHNVTSIAMDCGFTHLSKFTSLFKAQFGECPSDALKRPDTR
jgi:hypothetical protein